MFSSLCHWIHINYHLLIVLKEKWSVLPTKQEIYCGVERRFGYPVAWNLVKAT